VCAAAVLAIMPGTLRRTRVSGAGAWGDDKPAWAAWACGEPEANGDRLGTDGADSFESTANREGNSQSSHLPGSSAGSTGEIWEIIVSATRIVEIRIMSATADKSMSPGPRTRRTGRQRLNTLRRRAPIIIRRAEEARKSRAIAPKCPIVAELVDSSQMLSKNGAAGGARPWGNRARRISEGA